MPGAEPARTPHAVIVLAAGHGRRMGGPKALMRVAGEPWWRTQQRRLREAGCEPVWVISPHVRAALGREPDAPTDQVESDPDAPMFTSLWRGIEHLRGRPLPTRIFVLPADVPAPDPRTWTAIAGATGTGVAIPVFGGHRGHPVCLSANWIERVLDPAARAPRATGESSLRLDELIAGRAGEVAVADPSVVTNLNAPDDVARWLATRV